MELMKPGMNWPGEDAVSLLTRPDVSLCVEHLVDVYNLPEMLDLSEDEQNANPTACAVSLHRRLDEPASINVLPLTAGSLAICRVKYGIDIKVNATTAVPTLDMTKAPSWSLPRIPQRRFGSFRETAPEPRPDSPPKEH